VELAPPASQTAFAAEVAKEVAKDLLPPGTRRVLVAIVLVILAVLAARIMF
jgi:hypothetical protein